MPDVVLLVGLAAAATTASSQCSLNGALHPPYGGPQAECSCFGPWTGAHCGVLVRAPLPDDHIPAFGYSPNTTSWGGNAIKGDGLKAAADLQRIGEAGPLAASSTTNSF